MSGFKDHFSGHAADYARHRPRYPAALFEWLAAQSAGHELAWDAGAGNGQAARSLARYFDTVHATDASAEQVANASPAEGVVFAVEPAERSSLPDDSADLVTVGQALHWFEVDRFHTEARRVLRPGGLYADWCYALSRVDPEVDAVVDRLYRDIVGPWWPPERRLLENGYQDLPVPFDPVAAPAFRMAVPMALADFTGYLRTWSACKRYQHDKGYDPVDMVAADLAAAWGDPGARRTVHWPLTVRTGRV